MAFHPDVHSGEKFTPSVLLSNDVRHLVNRLDGFQSGIQKGFYAGTTRVQVFSTSAIDAGTAVNFPGKALCDGAIRVEVFSDFRYPWGVVTKKLAKNEVGDCVISGPITVPITGTIGDFAVPNPEEPTKFIRGSQGAPILYVSGGKAIVDLGKSPMEEYNGPFAIYYDYNLQKIIVGNGYATKGGKFVEVYGTELDPQEGTICVKWGAEPTVDFGTPGLNNYPIGVVFKLGSGDNASYKIYCCRVSVAHFGDENYDGPFSAKYDDESGSVVIASGYASQNGDFVSVGGKTLSAQNGIICVSSTLSGGSWSTPTIQYASPSKNNFPIAKCSISGSGENRTVMVSSCRVGVAVFIATAECPVAAKQKD